MSTPTTEAASKSKAGMELNISREVIIAYSGGRGIPPRLTQLARNGARIAADVEAGLGREESWD
jgi:hypothetical protein